VGLERGPLSLVSTIEELLERKNGGSGLEIENTSVGIRRADHVTPLYPQKLALTSPTSGGGSVGIIRSRTKSTEFSLVFSFMFEGNVTKLCLFQPKFCHGNLCYIPL
jgi:hypothetical protein